MTNLTQLAPDLVLQQVQQVLKIALSQWQTTKWNEVELAITLFYQVCPCFLPSDRNFKLQTKIITNHWLYLKHSS